MRRFCAITLVVTALSIAACSTAGGVASPSAHPSTEPSQVTAASERVLPSPSVATARPTPLPSSSPPSSLAPISGPRYLLYDMLRVAADDVPVREAPSNESPLLQAWRGADSVGDAHVHAGEYVSVELGPLIVDGETWYLVRPAEDGQLFYSTTSWRRATDDGGSNAGWVVTASPAGQRLVLDRRLDPNEGRPDGPTLVPSETGDYVSPPQPRHDLFSILWAIAPDEGTCRFDARIVPTDGPDPVVVANVTTDRVAASPLSGPGTMVSTPWTRSANGSGGWEAYTLRVASDCPWTLSLWPVPHD